MSLLTFSFIFLIQVLSCLGELCSLWVPLFIHFVNQSACPNLYIMIDTRTHILYIKIINPARRSSILVSHQTTIRYNLVGRLLSVLNCCLYKYAYGGNKPLDREHVRCNLPVWLFLFFPLFFRKCLPLSLWFRWLVLLGKCNLRATLS